MAKKKAAKVNATDERKLVKPVRLDLSAADHATLEEITEELGTSMATYVRMLVKEKLKAYRSEKR